MESISHLVLLCPALRHFVQKLVCTGKPAFFSGKVLSEVLRLDLVLHFIEFLFFGTVLSSIGRDSSRSKEDACVMLLLLDSFFDAMSALERKLLTLGRPFFLTTKGALMLRISVSLSPALLP